LQAEGLRYSKFGRCDKFNASKTLQQFTISQAFSLQINLQHTWGDAPGCYNPDFQSDDARKDVCKAKGNALGFY
jgi:hypothetical protein